MNYNMSQQDYKTVIKILDRMTERVPDADRLTVAMDLEAVHTSGCPLDFDRLLAFDNLDFFHDLSGISKHIDRKTGKLGDCFEPRCAKVEKPAKTRRILTIREMTVYSMEVPAEVNDDNAFDWLEENDCWPDKGDIENRTFLVEEVAE